MGTVLGPLAEAAVLGLVGVSLYAGRSVLQGKVAAPPSSIAKEA
jgi:hypothetical protein